MTLNVLKSRALLPHNFLIFQEFLNIKNGYLFQLYSSQTLSIQLYIQAYAIER